VRAALLLGLVTTTLSCAPPQAKGVEWSVHPSGTGGERIVHRAVQFDVSDVPVLRKAGGLPVGTLTMKGEWKQAELTAAVEKAAADHGGTHFTQGEWAGSPASWDVTRVAPTTTNARYVIVRVPANAWHRIPPSLVPEPYAGMD
jgi:hypothetical protein